MATSNKISASPGPGVKINIKGTEYEVSYFKYDVESHECSLKLKNSTTIYKSNFDVIYDLSQKLEKPDNLLSIDSLEVIDRSSVGDEYYDINFKTMQPNEDGVSILCDGPHYTFEELGFDENKMFPVELDDLNDNGIKDNEEPTIDPESNVNPELTVEGDVDMLSEEWREELQYVCSRTGILGLCNVLKDMIDNKGWTPGEVESKLRLYCNRRSLYLDVDKLFNK